MKTFDLAIIFEVKAHNYKTAQQKLAKEINEKLSVGENEIIVYAYAPQYEKDEDGQRVVYLSNENAECRRPWSCR